MEKTKCVMTKNSHCKIGRYDECRTCAEGLKKKQGLMQDYFKKHGAPEEISYQESQERLKNCTWCDEFRRAGNLHCLHCGVALR